MADAPDLGSGGQPWGFKSLLPHQTRNKKWKMEIGVNAWVSFALDFSLFTFVCGLCEYKGNARV